MADEVFDIQFNFASDADDALADLDALSDDMDDISDDIGILGDESRKSSTDVDALSGSVRGMVLPFLTGAFAGGIFAGVLGSIISNSASLQNAMDAVQAGFGRVVDTLVGQALDDIATSVVGLTGEFSLLLEEVNEFGRIDVPGLGLFESLPGYLDSLTQYLAEARRLRREGEIPLNAPFSDVIAAPAREFLTGDPNSPLLSQDFVREQVLPNLLPEGISNFVFGETRNPFDILANQDRHLFPGSIPDFRGRLFGDRQTSGTDSLENFLTQNSDNPLPNLRGIFDRIELPSIPFLSGRDNAPELPGGGVAPELPTGRAPTPSGGSASITVHINAPVQSPAQARQMARLGVEEALGNPGVRNRTLGAARP